MWTKWWPGGKHGCVEVTRSRVQIQLWFQIELIAERMMSEADKDRDDFLSFEEFKNSLRRTDVEKKMSIRFLD